MTDYLDELLEDISAEDSPANLNWNRRTGRSTAVTGAGSAQASGTESTVVSAQDVSEQTVSAAARVAREWASSRQAIRRSARSIPTVPGGSFTAAESRSVSAITVSAAQVDAVFQRDARRYDGPLCLL